MQILKLLVRDFRSFREAVFEFGPGINLICGPNGSGKTTLLEAIALLIGGRSFRGKSRSELIREGAETSLYHVEAVFLRHGIEQRLRIVGDGKTRKIAYNNVPCTSIVALFGLLQGVVMTPDDNSLIKGASGDRRRFLDVQIAQVDPLFVRYSSRYLRAIQQRNTLFRAGSLAGIESFEAILAEAGTYIAKERRRASLELSETAVPIQEWMSGGGESLSLKYSGLAITEEEYRLQLARHRTRELELRHTTFGVHRDDLTLRINGLDARLFASEGQQRCSVAALRLAEWTRLARLGEGTPLMLVDDMAIGLDAHRRELFLSRLATCGQVLLTTTDSVPCKGDIHEIILAK